MKHFLLAALIPAVALAQKPPAGCPLLTAAEINSATGMKVGEPHETDVDVPSSAGQAKVPMTGCMWRVGEHGMANVAVLAAVGTKEQREAGMAKLRQSYDVLRSKGWSVTETRIADTLCSTATPPAAESEHSPAMTGCFGVARGFVYSVGVMGPHFKTPSDKVKALGDDVVKRLP